MTTADPVDGAPPLDGVRVVDLTHVMAGPFCTHRLALLGADVIKVEPRGGDIFRDYHGQDTSLGGDSAVFVGINAGKRSVALDLKSPGGAEAMRRLVDDADVVVENFRPGVATRLGLAPEETRRRNPRLVHCSMSGYGQSGPMRDWPAYDHILQAVSGVMTLTGDEGNPPLKAGFPLVDTFAGHSAATSIITALLQRERTGRGDVLDVAMLDNALLLMVSMVLPYVMIGEEPRRVGNRGYNLSPTSDTFATGEGDLAIGANTGAQFTSLCDVVGRPDLPDDERFATREARMANAEQLRDELEAALAARSALQWEDALNAASVPAGAIRTVPEACDLPHVRARELFQSVPAPHYGRDVTTLGLGTQFEKMPWGVDHAAPALGEHTVEVLGELGFGPEEVEQLVAAGAAFTPHDEHDDDPW